MEWAFDEDNQAVSPFASIFIAFNDVGREIVWLHLKDEWDDEEIRLVIIKYK